MHTSECCLIILLPDLFNQIFRDGMVILLPFGVCLKIKSCGLYNLTDSAHIL